MSFILANFIIYFANMMAFIFGCWPRDALWSPFVSGKCVDTTALMISSAVMNVVSDIGIITLPAVGVARLQMPLTRKAGVVAIFATGAL